jgi:small-conductance mechanosensitive channel
MADLSAAGAIAWGILCVAISRWLPGGSYLAAWPALFALIGLFNTLQPSQSKTGAKSTLRILLASIPALLMLPPSIGLFYTALMIPNAFVVAPLIALTTWLLITSGCVATLLALDPIRTGTPVSR